MKAVIYARYSSDNQREESIEGQLRECNEYARYNDIEVVGQYIDRAFSAKTDHRPDFQRMIKDSAKRQFDIILVWKLDRFARNRYDSAHYKAILKKNGVRVVSAMETIAEGSEGILLESVLEGMAEYYSAELSEKVRRGFKENALKARWNGGAVPFGYVVSNHKLEIDPTTSEIVKLMYQMCGDGKTVKEIYDFLIEKNIRRPNGKVLGYTSIRYILSNRTYIGEYNHSGVVIPNGVPAIVDELTFEEAQKTIQKHSIAPAQNSAEDIYLLTTKLFCGKCGAMMTAYSGTSQTQKTYRYYACNRARKKLCDKEKIPKEKLEAFIVYKTTELLKKDKTIDRLATLLYDLQYTESTILPRLEEQLKEKKKEIDNIVTAIQKGVASDTLLKRLNELEIQKAAVEETIATEKIKSPMFTKDEYKLSLLNFRKIDTSKLEGRQKLIDTFVNVIYLYDDCIKIIYNDKEKEEIIPLSELDSSSFLQYSQS